jgi:hypothetical protein
MDQHVSADGVQVLLNEYTDARNTGGRWRIWATWCIEKDRWQSLIDGVANSGK